jgi:predicted metal-dependent phosphoesterase TrpH
MRADLHSHTTCSDGEFTPLALVTRAVAAGVTHLAVTDHDTIAGLTAAGAAGRQAGVEIIPGIEITTRLNSRECHVLGHHLLPGAPGLADWCDRRRRDRHDRLREMTARLTSKGIVVDFEEVEREAAGATPGRPHLARVLVRRGYVRTFQEAFDRYLEPGKSGYVDRARPEAAEVIALVRAAGGTTSLAHPGVNRVSRAELGALAQLGLDAVEAYHPDHPPQQAGDIARWAKDLKLFVTGGSDFHGVHTTSVELGARTTPKDSFEGLSQLASTRQGSERLAAARDQWARATTAVPRLPGMPV